MCKAAEELIEDWKEEGREEGRAEGRAEGRVEERDDMRNKYESLKAEGRSSDEILSVLFK